MFPNFRLGFRTGLVFLLGIVRHEKHRHCEEHSDEATQTQHRNDQLGCFVAMLLAMTVLEMAADKDKDVCALPFLRLAGTLALHKKKYFFLLYAIK